MSGKALAEKVLGGLFDLGFDIRYCHGQGYDGTAVVSGQINGLSAHICKSFAPNSQKKKLSDFRPTQ